MAPRRRNWRGLPVIQQRGEGPLCDHSIHDGFDKKMQAVTMADRSKRCGQTSTRAVATKTEILAYFSTNNLSKKKLIIMRLFNHRSHFPIDEMSFTLQAKTILGTC